MQNHYEKCTCDDCTSEQSTANKIMAVFALLWLAAIGVVILYWIYVVFTQPMFF